MARTYIYGVIPASQSLAFGLSGFPPRPEEVRTVAHRGLACVASNYSGEDFASLPKEMLLRCLMAHQEVVERVMQAFAHLAKGPVRRYELPKLRALNFVIEGALGGGVTRSLAQDVHGKSLSSLMLTIELPGRDARPESARAKATA